MKRFILLCLVLLGVSAGVFASSITSPWVDPTIITAIGVTTGTINSTLTLTAATTGSMVLKSGDTMSGPLIVLSSITANNFYGDGVGITGIVAVSTTNVDVQCRLATGTLVQVIGVSTGIIYTRLDTVCVATGTIIRTVGLSTGVINTRLDMVCVATGSVAQFVGISTGIITDRIIALETRTTDFATLSKGVTFTSSVTCITYPTILFQLKVTSPTILYGYKNDYITATTFTATNTYTRIVGSTTIDAISGYFDMPSSGTWRSRIGYSKIMRISVSGYFKETSGNNTYKFALYQNGAQVNSCESEASCPNTVQVTLFNLTAIAAMAQNDILEIYAKNKTGATGLDYVCYGIVVSPAH